MSDHDFLVQQIRAMLADIDEARTKLQKAQGDFDTVKDRLVELRMTTDKSSYAAAYKEAQR
jgi:hypothetical protein